MKIAIVGAGLAGLGVAWHLLNSKIKKKVKVTLFDKEGIGMGASSVAAGLMHPFSGKRAKMTPLADEKIKETLKLVKSATKTLRFSPVLHKGLLRIAITDEQKEFFFECSKSYSDVKWLDANECQKIFPQLSLNPGILIKNAYAIDTSSYLKGLYQACLSAGLIYVNEKVTDTTKLNNYDIIILAAGAGIFNFPESERFKLRIVKGQALIYPWPSRWPKLPFAINSRAYIAMRPDQNTCIVGATFERSNTSLSSDITFAKQKLLPLLKPLMPELAKVEPIRCVVGLRVTTPTHTPFFEQAKKNIWVVSGLGSKGLLSHAYLGKKLAEAIISLL